MPDCIAFIWRTTGKICELLFPGTLCPLQLLSAPGGSKKVPSVYAGSWITLPIPPTALHTLKNKSCSTQARQTWPQPFLLLNTINSAFLRGGTHWDEPAELDLSTEAEIKASGTQTAWVKSRTSEIQPKGWTIAQWSTYTFRSVSRTCGSTIGTVTSH